MCESSVVVTYLELRSGDRLIVPKKTRPDYKLRHVQGDHSEFGRFLYSSVGAGWHWTDRLKWTAHDWNTYLNRPEIETWAIHIGSKTAGYFELSTSQAEPNRDDESGVQIVQFGLFPSFIGDGVGGFLLCDAVFRGREIGNGRIWLHTCTQDHPHALSNYEARGFCQYKNEYRNRP